MATAKKMILPSMLAFERKLEVSDALMHSVSWGGFNDNPQPIKVVPRNNRSTQSAFGIKDDDKSKPNPVSADTDDANLPHDKDTLKVNFSLRVVGDLGKPFGCNDPAFEKAIQEKVADFKAQGLKELAHRYAHNIASGRFLWRNRVGAEDVLVKVKINRAETTVDFDGREFSLNDFESSRSNQNLKLLSDSLYAGLNGTDDFVLLEVDAYVRLGAGQHVFPSQEMNMGEKKKVLFKLDNCAALHSVKIGNAIRTVDDWYSEDAEFPIAAEPYGSVTQRGEAYRTSKIDLYTLMMNWINGEAVDDGQKCFILANLIRGGVFGGKSE